MQMLLDHQSSPLSLSIRLLAVAEVEKQHYNQSQLRRLFLPYVQPIYRAFSPALNEYKL
jgi:hypothetical protein